MLYSTGLYFKDIHAMHSKRESKTLVQLGLFSQKLLKSILSFFYSADLAVFIFAISVNEAMLTGESVPVTKTSVRCKQPNEDVELYTHREHQKHTLFR